MMKSLDRPGPMAAVFLVLFSLVTAFSLLEEKTERARVWVHIKDDQGRPTAARIYLRVDGEPQVPSGSLERGQNGDRFFHTRGFFQIEIPPGRVEVEAVKGFEYRPVKQELDLNYLELRNRTSVMNLELNRYVDLPSQGWFSGDVHMHPNHRIGDLYVTMEDVALLAQAEDIHVSNLLISNRQGTTRVFDTEFFSDGQPDPASTRDHLLVVQEEFRNTDGLYGHMVLLGIKRLIQPFFTGLRPDWEDYPPNYAIAKQAKAQGGIVSYAHPADEPAIPTELHVAREFPVDLALGVVDAIDLLSNKDEEAACWMYYRVLNSGLRCAASAGSDTQMDVANRRSLPGGNRVYVQLEPPLTYEKWLNGLGQGRTFVTNGPLLFLEVNGRGPGQELHLQKGDSLTVKARAQSLVPMNRLELVVNGDVVAGQESESSHSLTLEHTLKPEKSIWIAARVWGDSHPRVTNDARVFAHTSPVYGMVERKKVAVPEDAAIVQAWIERLIADVQDRGRFSSETRRQEILSLFARAKSYYESVARQTRE